MPSLIDIKRRIRSVKNTQKITRAMKMVAASKLRRAQEAIEQARPYALSMRGLVNNLASRAELDMHPLLHPGDKSGNIGLVVITSDRGLCGAFNSNIVHAALDHIRSKFQDKKVTLTIVGRKGVDLLRRRHDTIGETYTGPAANPVMETSGVIIKDVSDHFAHGDTDEIYCVYNEFKSALTQQVTLEKLLPFEPTPAEKGEAPIDYIYEPSQTDVFEALLWKHLQIQMHRILNESAASEHGARMTAMDAATTNAGDMIDRLELQYNHARQDAITKELIEVVSGAEAL